MQTLKFLLLVALSQTLCAAAAPGPAATFAGRSVSTALVKARASATAAKPRASIKLQAVEESVRDVESLAARLSDNGIVPDTEAFTLVYDLNRDSKVRDAQSLAQIGTVKLPAIAGAARARVIRGGYLVEITVDPEIHKSLNDIVADLQRLKPSIDGMTSANDVRTQLQGLVDSYQQIVDTFNHRTGPTLRHETLVQMEGEARLLRSIAQQTTREKRQLTGAEEQQIAAIYDDIDTEMKRYVQVHGSGSVPGPQPFYKVTVIIEGPEPKLIASLRVYYTYRGLFRSLPANAPLAWLDSFMTLGSGGFRNLYMKNYVFWAARNGDPDHPLTVPYTLRIDSASPPSFSIDLGVAGVAQ